MRGIPLTSPFSFSPLFFLRIDVYLRLRRYRRLRQESLRPIRYRCWRRCRWWRHHRRLRNKPIRWRDILRRQNRWGWRHSRNIGQKSVVRNVVHIRDKSLCSGSGRSLRIKSLRGRRSRYCQGRGCIQEKNSAREKGRRKKNHWTHICLHRSVSAEFYT